MLSSYSKEGSSLSMYRPRRMAGAPEIASGKASSNLFWVYAGVPGEPAGYR